jgi:D-3-phosphoglycerate dehydrogenase
MRSMNVTANRRVLVVSTSFGSTTPYPRRILEEHGCEVVSVKGPHSEARMAELVPGFAAVVVGIDPITEAVVGAGRDLKLVAKHGVGVDNIDLAACTRHNVVVTNVPAANSEAVSEFTMCVLLALSRHLVPAVASLAGGRWEGSRFIGVELGGKTLGIVGLGAIGQRVALHAKAFGMDVVYFDAVRRTEFEASEAVTYLGLDSLLQQADFVTLHVPALPETHNLIDAHGLSLMKPTAYLLNLSRGEVLDEGALIEVLRHHRIAGAALDAFCQEPLGAEHPFFTLDNVLLTPHMAGYSREANERTSIAAAEDVARVLTGQAPLNALNLGALGMHEAGAMRQEA